MGWPNPRWPDLVRVRFGFDNFGCVLIDPEVPPWKLEKAGQ